MKIRPDNLDLSTNTFIPAPATFNIVGSTGNNYTVTADYAAGEWTCTCPHYTHRRVECKHIKETKLKIRNGTW